MYWFGYNISVGDSHSLRLLIDTGSTDLILNPGKYKPSSHEKPYGTGKFVTGYEGVNRAGFGFEFVSQLHRRCTVVANRRLAFYS